MDLKDYIKTYTCIPPKTISKLVRWANNQAFTEAQTIGGLNKEIRNVLEYNFHVDGRSYTKSKWYNYFSNIFLNVSDKYKQDTLNKHIDIKYVTNINLLKYEKDYFYVQHVDHAASVPRTLSLIAFLNNDYEGGELIFSLGKEEYVVKPEVGKVIIWPSTFSYPHRVKAVTKGTRYVVVGWLL